MRQSASVSLPGLFDKADHVLADDRILERDAEMFKPFEVAQIANLSPGSSEEAKALIPS